MGDGERALLTAGLQAVGVQAAPGALELILRHLALVAEWNERINLTAIRDSPGMVIKHAVDSATVLGLEEFPAECQVVDVGTGAGFPGIILKCLRPDLRVTLVDSLQKRCRFLEAASTQLFGGSALRDGSVRVVWSRAEDVGTAKEFREAFDVVVARAVADLRILCEYCLPLSRVGGRFLAMKGPDVAEELRGADKAIHTLGGTVQKVHQVQLPEGAGGRTVITIAKERVSPKQYPRKAGTAEKSPL